MEKIPHGSGDFFSATKKEFFNRIGQNPPFRIGSFSSASGTLLAFLKGDIIQFQDHGIPEK
jgi:hypothetical protein